METVEDCLSRHGFSNEAKMKGDMRLVFQCYRLQYKKVEKVYAQLKKYLWFYEVKDHTIYHHRPLELGCSVL